MLIARDRYGIKPLYYNICGDSFRFGSEQRAICALEGQRREVDIEGLYEYFTFQNIFSGKTFLRGIHLLKPGHYIEISENNKTIEEKQYWDFCFKEPENKIDEREYVEELQRLVQQAVRRQCISDVEIGSYLSGGIDSGTVCGLAVKELDKLKTFTCGFDMSSAEGLELGFDERETADRLSGLFGTQHYTVTLKSGDMERSLGPVVDSLEEQRVGQCYPNYYTAELASKFVKVVLSGCGGDELFGGYPWRYYQGTRSKSFDQYIDQYYKYWQRLANNKTLKEVFSPVRDKIEGVWTQEIFRNVFPERMKNPESQEDYVNLSLYFESKTFLHGLLVVEDKLSMRHGLETRLPLLDNDLVDFSIECPINMKLKNLKGIMNVNENDALEKWARHLKNEGDGKYLLRKAASKVMPKDVIWRKKQGFSAPDASWFKGKSMSFIKDSLYRKNAKIYDYLDHKVVTSLIDEHLSGKLNRRLLIWSLLSVNRWLEINT